MARSNPSLNANRPPEIATEIILESISDGVFTIDENWRITSFNRAAEAITGVNRREAIGNRCSDVFRSTMCEAHCALRTTIETGAVRVNNAGYIINAQGKRIPISVSTALLRDAQGKAIGGVETFRDLSTVEELRKEILGRFQLGDILTRSPNMRRLLDFLPRVAESESTVLVQGETGTGKELLARAIHGASARRQGPFVAVNCGALPETLLESELFGYKAGAFTGANRDKLGRFALARGGTLFLDEIGELSQALQVKLLRVLQEKQYEPLGSTRSEEANVRVVTASHRDLAAMVETDVFRRDLYYRIKVIRLELPPLRERRDDIPLLVEHFVASFNAVQNKQVTGVSRDVLALLMALPYPGNIRELQNIVEHAFVMVSGGQIELSHLPDDIVPLVRDAASRTGVRGAKDVVEAQAIRDAIERNGGNRLLAAEVLGMHKSTLFRRIKQLGIEMPENDGRSAARRRPVNER
jgi:PAS domain S-box-containing protein